MAFGQVLSFVDPARMTCTVTRRKDSLLGLSSGGDGERERRNKFKGFKIISSLPGSQLTAVTSQHGGGLVSSLLSGGNREIKKSREGGGREREGGGEREEEREEQESRGIHTDRDSEGGRERGRETDRHKRERERFPSEDSGPILFVWL